MSKLYEELDYCATEIGVLSLRRRWEPRLGKDVYEIKLGDEHLMSDVFTVSEIALADLGLSAVIGSELRVVVGGLGMGYTALAALKDERVASVSVVELLEPVIDWHRRGILPIGDALCTDHRVSLVQGDFFELASAPNGFDPDNPNVSYDAILLDIDHSPEMLLDNRSSAFYRPEGLKAMAKHLRPGGVFGLWSNEAPSDAFTDILREVFPEAWAEPVVFRNPYNHSEIVQTVYLARTASESMDGK
ncbi:MAG: spermidine synthase [Hyphomonas sp.]